MVISKAEGEALVSAVMAMNSACFLDNKWEPSRKLYADTVSWDWSGGVTGKGTWDDFVQVLSGSWGAVVSQFRPSNVYTVVCASFFCFHKSIGYLSRALLLFTVCVASGRHHGRNYHVHF